MAVYTPANSSELAAITTTTGDTVLLRSGVTYAASSVPAALVSPAGITLGVSGTGAAPIISGGTVRADWSYDAPNNVYSRPALGGNTLGNVIEDGYPMKYVAWNTNIATTAAAMNAGQSLPYWSGSMTYDPATNIVYIRPSSGTPSQHEYIVSESLYGITNSATNSGLVIDGIEFRSISRHGVVLFNKTNLEISNCAFNVIGGLKPSSLWLGNGIEISKGCWGVEVTDCSFTDIFDSAVTSQLYESVPASIGSHLWSGITAARCGLHVVEISCQTDNQVISDIETVNVASRDHGVGWSGDRNGAVMTNLTQGPASRVTRSFARDITGSVQRRLYIGFQHGGVCGIEDSTGTGTYGAAPVSTQGTGLADQVDLWRNVSDNLGAPSGGKWVASTARMSRHFAPLCV